MYSWVFLFSYVIAFALIITVNHSINPPIRTWVSLWWVSYNYRKEGETLLTSLETSVNLLKQAT